VFEKGCRQRIAGWVGRQGVIGASSARGGGGFGAEVESGRSFSKTQLLPGMGQ